MKKYFKRNLKEEILFKIVIFLAKRWPVFVYFCGTQIFIESTSKQYSSTDVTKISMVEAISRFARIHAIPGHGRDEFYDSNREMKNDENQ